MSSINEKKPIRVLQVIGSLGLGGAETMIINIYNAMDHNKLEFDFVVFGSNIGYYESFIDTEKSRIFHITKRSSSLKKHINELTKVCRDGNYSVVHIHTQNAFTASIDAYCAKRAGVKKVVSHCHNTSDWRDRKLLLLSKLSRPMLNYIVDSKLSCGVAAAEYLYGSLKNVEILPLPVYCDKYLYSDEMYQILRKQKDFSDELVFVHTGRFAEPKNHKFLIEVFRELHTRDPKCKLLLLGDGKLRDEIEEQIQFNGLQKSVLVLGNVDDVYNKLIMADAFIFPSLYEGFPTVLLEAQAAGLPCFVSDSVTKDIKVTDLVHFLSLDDKASEWAEAILSQIHNKRQRHVYNDIIKREFDISVTMKKLFAIYEMCE